MSAPKPEVHERPEPDEEQTTELVAVPPDGMVDVQIATGKRFPRSVTVFRKQAEELACLDEETAGECLYTLIRKSKDGPKTIEGPSARFAEILLYSWGNSRAEAEVVDEGETHVTAQGTFYDLERNVAVRKKVKRRITDSSGRRYNDDMIGVTGNAAISIALRNAVFAGIPKALWKAIYQRARAASIGKAGTLTQARQNTLAVFGKMGVQPEKVFALLEIKGMDDITQDHLVTLRGLANAIKEGEATVEETFNPRSANSAETPDLNARVRAAAEGKRPA